ERLDRPGDQRLAAHFEKHLGDRVAEGPHAFAAPCGKNHRFRHSKSERVANALVLGLERLEQTPERGKLAITPAGAPQVAHHERLVFQIAALAVPKGKTREDPQHLELPLGSHPLELPADTRACARLFPRIVENAFSRVWSCAASSSRCSWRAMYQSGKRRNSFSSNSLS